MCDSPDFVVSIIKEHWQEGKKLLEIGCGPAFLRKHFVNDYIGCDITNTDYAPGIPRDVDVVCAANNLKFDSETIDIIIIKSAFYLFPNHLKSLDEAIRVLKKNGKILIFDYNTRTQKILQKQENHKNYPCWSHWSLKKIVASNKKIKNVKNYLATNVQPKGFKRLYHLLRQEILGTWAIVYGEKI